MLGATAGRPITLLDYAAREWQAYLSLWTTWTHVRTMAPLLGSVLLLVGLRYR